MKRRFGQWKEGANTKKPSKIEFYEYVEAVKITGDAYVPAGQVIHSFMCLCCWTTNTSL